MDGPGSRRHLRRILRAKRKMEISMSDKIRTFVDCWIQSHVHAEGYQLKGDKRLAKLLASKCVEMAKSEGISASDIDAEFGDIVEHMHGQIKRVNDDLAANRRDVDRANATQSESRSDHPGLLSRPAGPFACSRRS
jgi:hypothetical protein